MRRARLGGLVLGACVALLLIQWWPTAWTPPRPTVSPRLAFAQYPPFYQNKGIWQCSLDNIGATLTQCLAAPTFQAFITSIVAQSIDATAGLMSIQSGTGTNCGTGTAALFPSITTTPRFAYAGFGSPPTVVFLASPLPAPSGAAICAIGTATHTLTIQMTGFYN
jgi:hypothetical protein